MKQRPAVNGIGHRVAVLAAASWVLVGITGPLRAETIVLANGTQLTGHVLTSEPGPNEPYVIQLEGGGKVTLTAAQVQQVVPDNPRQTEYRQRLANLADTPAAHWELAEWCRGQQLKDLREAHLQHVLRLDPEHADARHALGFVQRGGAWVQPDDWMASQGFVYFRNRWRSPQDVAMIQQAEEHEKGVKKWRREIRDGFDGRVTIDLEQAMADVQDPLAIEAMSLELGVRKNPQHRMILINILGKANTPLANRALVQSAIFDPDSDTRDVALDWLSRNKPRDLTGVVVTALRHRENTVVNRAATVLTALGDQAAIPYLIPALTTVHRVPLPASPGIQAGFGRGADGGPAGAGLSMGERPKFKDTPIDNQSVLGALRNLTQADFEYHQPSWWEWYIAATTPQYVNLRRSE